MRPVFASAALLLLSPLIASSQQVSPTLFRESSNSAVRLAQTQAHVVRAREVIVDPLVVPAADESAPDTLRLNFFDDVNIEVHLDRLQKRGERDYTWIGAIVGEDEPDGFILVVKDDAVIAKVRSIRAGDFQLTVSAEGRTVVRELDNSRLPGCGTGEEQSISAPAGRAESIGPRDSSDVMDIIVGYTPAARAAAGGNAAIEAAINMAVADANNAYLFSNIPTELRLVNTWEVTYTESGDSSTDLSRLQTPGDGWLEGALSRRNTYGADFVALVTEANDVCGIGYRMTSLSPFFEANAFSITVRDCLSNDTLAHEVGHNLGCHHAVGDAGLVRGGPILHTWSYGWRWTGLSGAQWRSVMAYEPGARAPRFSNPDILYDGVATGVPIGTANEAHNAASITSAISTAANWRATVFPLLVSPVSPLASEGSLGGPFAPPDKTYALHASGNSSVNWTATKTQPWVTLSSGGGTLTAGASINVVASINSNANALPPGSYTDTITFTDTTNGIASTRDVSLEVLPQAIQSFNFDTDPGWTTQGLWAFGTPQGSGGDPASGRSGSNVYGYNLAGLYQNNLPEYYLRTTPINCTGFENVTLRFWRWLGIESSTFDSARIDVSNNGTNWTTVWEHSGASFQDASWVLQSFDISAIADLQPTVYVRWVMGSTDESVQYSGWNIDDVSILGDFTVPSNLSEAWVDFAHAGAELGTSVSPFNSISEAIAALRTDGLGVIKIKGDSADTTSPEIPRITAPMSIQSINGSVRVGAP